MIFLCHTTKSEKKEKVESRPYDDDSSDSIPSFTEAVKPPPAPGTDAFNKVNPSLDKVLAQNPRARKEISRFYEDNLAACVCNTAEQLDMLVPPPITPSGQKAGEAAKTKTSSTLTRNE